MNEIIELLQYHAKKYPIMMPCDAVKLIYQNEFGGGHLVRDEKLSLLMLTKEFAGVKHNNSTELTEPIGNGRLRLNLAAVDINILPINKINEMFVLSSNQISGSIETFINKLDALREAVITGIFEFSLNDLNSYLDEYKKSGYPAVSHSEIYRNEYHPAYRVINNQYFNKDYCNIPSIF